MTMSDREKIISDFEKLVERLFHRYKIAYKGDTEDYYEDFLIADAALELLKEQEEVTFKAKKAGTKTYPFWDVVCSGCGYTDAIIHEDWKFCPNCGKKVKWDEDGQVNQSPAGLGGTDPDAGEVQTADRGR